MPQQESPHSTATPAGPSATPEKTGFPAFMVVHSAWFVGMSLQLILFPYLVRIELNGSESQLGIAQMCLGLPMAMLILVGGIVADRVNLLRQIRNLYIVSALPPLAVGLLLVTGHFSYPTMLLYAMSFGVLSAFAVPSRDSLLARVAPRTDASGIQRAVTLVMLAQFCGQIGGMVLASGARFFGILPLLFFQSGLMLCTAGIVLMLRPRPQTRKSDRGAENVVAFALAQFMEGVRAVAASPAIRPLTILSFGIATLFVGTMQVTIPLIVQTYASADTEVASMIAISALSFWLGTIFVALVLLRVRTPQRAGRVVLLATMAGGVILLPASLPLPFWAFCGLIFFWGVANGTLITLSRGIVQHWAQGELRGRILSVAAFSFMAGGPIGALAWGFLAGAIGPHQTVLIPGVLGIFVGLAGLVFSNLSRLNTQGPAAQGTGRAQA